MAKPIWDEVLAEVARASEGAEPPFRVIVNDQAAAILEAAGWVRDRDFLVSEMASHL